MENLEITMKGWNLASSVSQALPFTLDTAQPSALVMNEDVAVAGRDDGHHELAREGEEGDADKEFNYVNDDKDLNEMYLL